MENVGIDIIEYRPEHQPWFEKFNRAWIEKHFHLEPIDLDVLQRPEEHILNPGGSILMIRNDGELAGTVALKHAADGVYEFTKMAIDEKFRGRKLGERLARAAVDKAKALGAHRIILYSSTKLKPALQLYRKLGFFEVPVDGPYARSDIKMERSLAASDITIRHAALADADTLVQLAERTFRESFGAVNTEEDMNLYVSTNFTLQKINDEINEAGSVFLLACDGETPVGFLRLRTGHTPDALRTENAMEIERLYAVASHIGKGVGKMLMGAALNYARDRNFTCVWLGVWEHNPRAIAFYKKWKFEMFGSHPFMLGNDAQTDLLMKKKL